MLFLSTGWVELFYSKLSTKVVIDMNCIKKTKKITTGEFFWSEVLFSGTLVLVTPESKARIFLKPKKKRIAIQKLFDKLASSFVQILFSFPSLYILAKRNLESIVLEQINHNMPLWAAETRIKDIQNVSQSAKKIAQKSPHPDPKQEATRMAALKKLRHRFVQLCSEHGDRSKPPVLAFERWLGRASLRKELGDDPIVPSDLLGNDGMLVTDEGLIKDIARTLPSWEASTKVANEMTKEASKQIRSMAALKQENSLGPKDLGSLRKTIREQGRAVKEATKIASDALKTYGEKETNDSVDPDRVTLLAALSSLQEATTVLNESASKAQKAAGGANSTKGGGNIVFNGARREGIYDVMLCGPCGKPRRPYLTVSSLHLSKLLKLWKLTVLLPIITIKTSQ